MFTWRSGSRVEPQLSSRKMKPRFGLAWACDPIGNQYLRGREFKPRWSPEFFFRLLYAIVKIAITTARTILHLISYPQFTYDLFHTHYSLTYLSREHMNPQLTCSQRQWLHSSVGRASHRYREVAGSSPVEVLNFFQASLRNCKDCDYNCEDHSSFDKKKNSWPRFQSGKTSAHLFLRSTTRELFAGSCNLDPRALLFCAWLRERRALGNPDTDTALIGFYIGQ